MATGPNLTANLTNITPPRVPLIDERTGLITREWYRFFLTLFNLTGGGTNNTSLTDLQVGPPSVQVEDFFKFDIEELKIQPSELSALEQIAELQKQIQALASQINCPCEELTVELKKQVEGLQAAPQFDIGAITAAISSLSAAPVTKTANFTVAVTELWLINNKAAATCTVTLPTASVYTGRVLYFLNYQAFTLVSASSNVVPLVGGAAGTAILAAVAGDTATLVSDGTNWIMTQYVPNNVLLLE